MRVIFSTCVILMLSGCSLLPYESEFSCRLKDNYGKCISVDDAYTEAVTGQSKGKPMIPPSERGFWQGDDDEAKEADEKNHSLSVNPQASSGDYTGYRSEVYRAMQGLLKQPETPMIKPAKTVRTLILSYGANNDKKRLYMPRYIYSIVEEPQFVFGQYKLQRDPQLVGMESFLNSAKGE